MSEQSGQEKTEAPTQRRLDRARNEGRVAVSSDLGAGIGLLAATILLWMFSETVVSQLCSVFRSDLHVARFETWGVAETQRLLIDFGTAAANVAWPFVAVALVVGMLASFLQIGLSISWDPLKPDIQRLSPTRGFSRIFSVKSLAKGGFAIVKVALVSLALWFVLRNEFADICMATGTHMGQVIGLSIALTVKAGFASAVILVSLGLADVLYQKWQFHRDLRMTRQDLKEEHKEDEGDPLLKARIKRLQREISQRKGLAEVGAATVVIRNPTHFAVALRYDRAGMKAPQVVAKGKGLLALRIIKLAEEHKVPVVENRPLAQSLYKLVEIDQEIPVELYAAVVEVLAYIYKLRRAA